MKLLERILQIVGFGSLALCLAFAFVVKPGEGRLDPTVGLFQWGLVLVLASIIVTARLAVLEEREGQP